MKQCIVVDKHRFPISIFLTAFLLCACESSEEKFWASQEERVGYIANVEKPPVLRQFYEEYLAKWPEGQYSQSAQLRLERLVWTDTIVGGHTDDYSSYLTRYPDGAHAPIARKINAWGETTENRKIARNLRTIRIQVSDLSPDMLSEYGNEVHQMSVLSSYLFRFVGIKVCAEAGCQPDADLIVTTQYSHQSSDYIDASSPAVQAPRKYRSGGNVEGNVSLVTREGQTLFESPFSSSAVPRSFSPGGRKQVTRSHLIYIGKQSLGARLLHHLTELYGPQLWLSYFVNKGDLWYDKNRFIDAAIVAGVSDPYEAFKPKIEDTLSTLSDDITDTLFMDDHRTLLYWKKDNKYITRDEFNAIRSVCRDNVLGGVGPGMGYFTPDP